MPVKHKSIIVMDKWTIIGAVLGGIWGLISLIIWILISLESSSASPPITFKILTLPASLPILVSSRLYEYGIIDISSTLLVLSIPIFGIVIGIVISILISYIYKKQKT